MLHRSSTIVTIAALLSLAASQNVSAQSAGAGDIVIAQKGKDGSNAGGRGGPGPRGGRDGGPSVSGGKGPGGAGGAGPRIDVPRGSPGGNVIRRGDGGVRDGGVLRGGSSRDGGALRGSTAPRYGGRAAGSGRPWLGGRRYLWAPGLTFYFYNGYYYGDCNWLRRRALATGSRYWWQRYRRCRNVY